MKREIPNYKSADESICFNDGTTIIGADGKLEKKLDSGISPIIRPLPKPPKLEKIIGYGLKPVDQYWDKLRPRPSDTLQEIIDDTDMGREEKIALLEHNPVYYKNEIDYIEKEQEYIRHGFWFFNKGKPLKLTCDNYYYCQYWLMDSDGRNPYFSIRDWEWFWSVQMFGVEDDAHFGTNHPKERRIGDSNKAEACGLRRTLTTSNHNTIIQSKDDDHAAIIFERMTMVNWDNTPFYLQPIWNLDYQNKSAIKCFAPRVKTHPNYKKKAFNSIMTYTNSGENAIDGSRQNLIINEESGKTITANCYERYYVQKPCLMVGGTKRGFMINVSTVEEMVSGGGANYFKLCEESHLTPPLKINKSFYKPNKDNGATYSGLVNIFIPCNEGYYLEEKDEKGVVVKKSIDKYGYADLKWTTSHIMNERKTIERGRSEDYIAHLKKFPMWWDDCWRIVTEGCHFDVKILNKRLDEIAYMGSRPYRKGNLFWVDGKPDGLVDWKDDNENGRWIISKLLSNNEANRFTMQNGKKFPDNWLKFILGCDPYKYGKKKGSDGGGAVFLKRDPNLDPLEKDVSLWTTHNFACTYSWRHRDLDAYGEDMIMTAQYFGCKMAEETNYTYLNNYFERRGYVNYLHRFFDQHGMLKEEAGQDTQMRQKMEYFRLLDDFVSKHGLRINHPEFIEDCLHLQDDFQPFDRLVACAMALKAARQEEEYNIFKKVTNVVADTTLEQYFAGHEIPMS